MKKLGFLLVAMGLGMTFVGCEPPKKKEEPKVTDPAPATPPAETPAETK